MSHEAMSPDAAAPDARSEDGLDEARPVDDSTLGSYFRVHDRPPAFDGPDGHPYTVSLETEKVPDLRHPWEGYLVFPRWARNGLGIVGHVETPTLWRGRSEEEVRQAAGDTPLIEVQRHLHAALLAGVDDADPV